ncbi:thioredoxin reductase [Ktedonobacter sp. SOSP1-85]|uniref:thioredoxin-disulfide reductase n=1 Tax=Ktedonobacter sp. SOSP1-85 TaxID=2778367 RepID=UPI001916B38B|nr:thioredoxin-disulfide reductase [Ktedonobacter sp. SOSP1-85]GHO80630.1 thioredoxin reductase [Ktedonobacter sp. SOSP1-85]
MENHVVIIGSGPAGLTAALYAGRSKLNPLLVRGELPGGLLATTDSVENFPGFPEEVGGVELALRMEEQAARFGARFLETMITRVDLSRQPFRLTTSEGEQIAAQTLIIAIGASPRKLGIPGEEEFTNRGVHYCANCDGIAFEGKRLVAIGGGNSALDEGLFLTRYVSELVLVHRRNELRADPILQERALANPKMRFLFNTTVRSIEGDEVVTGVRLMDLHSGQEEFLPTDGVFIYIGHEPNTALFRGQLDLDPAGYIRADISTRTSVPGVFAAGDVADPRYRQAITAAGDGCRAAMEAARFLADLPAKALV